MEDKIYKHPEIEIFYEYLDGELDSKNLTSFEDHLKSCKHCKVELKKFENFFTKISSIEEKEVSTDITNSVIEVLSSFALTNSRFIPSPIFQVFCSLLIFLSMIVFKIPINTLIPNEFFEWLAGINFDWMFEFQLSKLSLRVFDSLNTLNISIQTPDLLKFPTIQTDLIFVFVISSVFLWLLVNRILFSFQDRPKNLKIQNGG